MRLYKVSSDQPTLEGSGAAVKWAGSLASASDAKKELMAQHGLKRSEVGTQEVDVPTDKVGLISFLNSLEAVKA